MLTLADNYPTRKPNTLTIEKKGIRQDIPLTKTNWESAIALYTRLSRAKDTIVKQVAGVFWAQNIVFRIELDWALS